MFAAMFAFISRKRVPSYAATPLCPEFHVSTLPSVAVVCQPKAADGTAIELELAMSKEPFTSPPVAVQLPTAWATEWWLIVPVDTAALAALTGARNAAAAMANDDMILGVEIREMLGTAVHCKRAISRSVFAPENYGDYVNNP